MGQAKAAGDAILVETVLLIETLSCWLEKAEASGFREGFVDLGRELKAALEAEVLLKSRKKSVGESLRIYFGMKKEERAAHIAALHRRVRLLAQMTGDPDGQPPWSLEAE